jgi:hypothetical protein
MEVEVSTLTLDPAIVVYSSWAIAPAPERFIIVPLMKTQIQQMSLFFLVDRKSKVLILYHHLKRKTLLR